MNRQTIILHFTAILIAVMMTISGHRAWGQAAIEELGGGGGGASVPGASSSAAVPSAAPAYSAPVGSASREGNAMLELLRRVEELQVEVQRLRADVDGLNHDMEAMKNRQRDIYLDIDRRMQQVEAGGGRAPMAAAPVTTDPTAAASLIDANTARNAYAAAFKLLQDKQYDQAIAAFDDYLKQYRDSEYADNAQYWMGEANYVTRRFNKAEEAFSQMIQRYPSSAKIADAKLKLAFTYYEMARYDDARKALKRVIQEYPGTSSARIADERLQRMSREGR